MSVQLLVLQCLQALQPIHGCPTRLADEAIEMCLLATCKQWGSVCASCNITPILLESTPITGCRHREVELAHRTPSALANVESANCNWHACMFGGTALDIMQVKLDLSACKYHALCGMLCMCSSCGQPSSLHVHAISGYPGVLPAIL